MRNIILILTICLLFSSCLEQIELATETETRKVVVDGTFSDVLEMQTIKLSYSTITTSQIRVPLTGAKVVIEDQDKNSIELQEQEDDQGTYSVFHKAENGNQYRLKIALGNDETITSNFQNVPMTIPVDSISIQDSLTTFLDDDGKKRRLNSIHFYSNSSAPNIDNDLFLRYSLSTTYQVTEIICSPLHTPKKCFIKNDFRPQSIQLQTIEKSETPISFSQYLFFRPIDYPFGEIFGLDLSVLSYNKSEYNYWQDLKSLFDQNGDITDILPGRLRGNMKSTSGEDVLGQFAVVSKSRATKLVRNFDFSINQKPFCGFLGNPPWPRPDECCNCLLFDDSSLEKPDFWP